MSVRRHSRLASRRPDPDSIPLVTTASPAPPAKAEGTPSASGPVRQLLTRLTVALNRRRAYAAAHPMVQQSEQALVELVEPLVSRGQSVTIGVARSELVVDGIVVEGTGAVARELAERLHRRGVGALEFSSGVDLDGLQQVMAWLALEALPGDAADKMSSAAPTVPGILVGRVAYDRLILGDEEDATRHELTSIWRSLALAAFEEEWRDAGDDVAESPSRGEGDTGATAVPRGGQTGVSNETHRSTRGPYSTGAATGPDGGTGSTATDGAKSDSPMAVGASAMSRTQRHADAPTPAGAANDRAKDAATGGVASGAASATAASSAESTASSEADSGVDSPEDATDDADLLTQPDASPEDIAQAIERRVHHPPYARRVARVLLSVTQQVTNAPPAVRAELAERLCTVLRRIGEGSLASIVRAVGAGREQRQFLTSVVNALPISAVIEWLEVTARATDQELSHHLLRILAKLSSHADQSKSSVQAHDSLRAAASDLVSGWALADPNPIEHADLLDHIALAEAGANGNPSADLTVAPEAEAEAHDASLTSVSPPVAAPVNAPTSTPTTHVVAREPAEHDVPPETARVVQMALEINVAGVDAVDAAQAVLAGGHAAVLFAWLDQAPGKDAAATLREAALAPAALTAALILEPFDPVASRALLRAAGPEAMPALLDALEQANSRTARRMVFDRLCEFGAPLIPFISPRLDGSPPWYFARNLLALLREVTPASTETDAPRLSAFMQYLGHPSEQVRSEALRLLIEDRWTRDAALRRALDDENPRVVRLAVGAAAALAAERHVGSSDTTGHSVNGTASHRGPLSREVATRLVRILDTASVDEEYRVRAVRALAGSPGPFVRDWLLAHVSRRTRFLRRLALADGRPTVLAALQVLAHDYAHDSRVEPVLMLASGQRDARRDAVTATLTHPVPTETRHS